MHQQLLYRRMEAALEAACSEAGLDATGALLIRLHSNSVFHLPRENAVARIASTDGASGGISVSLAVTSWLESTGFPTVRPKMGRVVEHEGLTISFWVYVEPAAAHRSSVALAGLLRRLHAVQCPPVELPTMPSPLGGVAQAVQDHPEAFDADDREWLAGEITVCEQRWRAMKFVLPSGLIHGDAHPNNVLPSNAGPLLCDWDHVADGPREWDLVQSHYFHRRFPTPADDLDLAAVTYGWDIREWSGLASLISVREVSGLGAYIRTASAKPEARTELAYRIKTLRERNVEARWNSPSSS